MDSKYTIFAKNKHLSAASSPFSPNLKRKFSYSSPSSSTQPAAKRPHNTSKHSNTQFKHNFTKNDSLPNRNPLQDIQMQRKQLPVFAVQER